MSISAQLLGFRPPRIAMFLTFIAIATDRVAPMPVLPAFPATAALAAISGFAVMLRAWWLFKQKDTAICPTAKATVLVRHDVYSLTRNPMYLGMILMLSGLALYAGTLPFYGVAAVYFIIINHVFCVYEEQRLEALFGEEFLAYRQEVRRWL
jgi:protein-S-isoprenylcysteine O-methyltransferase Ste14